MTQNNIEDKQNKIVININWKKIEINKYYQKTGVIIKDWERIRTSKNASKFKIPYIVLKHEIKKIVNKLNQKNNWIFLIEDSFFIKLFDLLNFEENVWLTRKQKKEFILQIIKWILNKIYRKLNKYVSYEIDYIKSTDNDVRFKYEIVIRVNKRDNEVLWLKLKDDKIYENIIEIKNFDDLAKYFEIEDIKNLEKEIEIIDKKIKEEKDKIIVNILKKEKIEKQEQLNKQKKNLLEKIFKEFEKKVDNIPYIYQRIYHLYSRDNTWKEYNYSGLTVKISWIDNITEDDIEINPSSILKLNNLEAEVITKLVEKLKNEYKDIYIFRNPNTWNKCFEYEYEWIIHKFYPDFIF